MSRKPEWTTTDLENIDEVQCDVSQNHLKTVTFSEKIDDESCLLTDILQNQEPIQIVGQNNEISHHIIPEEVSSENSKICLENGSSYEEIYFEAGIKFVFKNISYSILTIKFHIFSQMRTKKMNMKLILFLPPLEIV